MKKICVGLEGHCFWTRWKIFKIQKGIIVGGGTFFLGNASICTKFTNKNRRYASPTSPTSPTYMSQYLRSKRNYQIKQKLSPRWFMAMIQMCVFYIYIIPIYTTYIIKNEDTSLEVLCLSSIELIFHVI